MQKQTQKRIWKFLERELATVLAVSFLMLGVVFTQADSLSADVSFTIVPPAGLITVTAPDGGESWAIGSAQNITWTSAGPITDVKIELQRSVAGAWEEIVASTENDGSYPWSVTEPATDSATIRVSKVGDASVNDISDSVFAITTATVIGGGGHRGGGGIATPMIDYVTPRAFSNSTAVDLLVRGTNFESDAKIFLGKQELSVKYNFGSEIKVTVPQGFTAGSYQLSLTNPSGGTGVYGTPITVFNDRYEAALVEQSPSPLTLLPNEKVEAWVKIKNTSNTTWLRDGFNQVQLGVVNDRASLFYDPATWLISNRAARMVENSVGYGEIGTFKFYIKAPAKDGDYTDSFALVAENIKWLNMAPVSWRVIVKSKILPPTTGGTEYYADRLLKQSPQRIELAPGQEATLWVDFENTGTITWTADGKNPVRIGTEKRRDRSSKFRGKNWVLKDRPSNVESVTAPGAVGRFTVNIKATSRVGTYKEYFGLVAEHKTWINGDLVYWEIVVKKPAKKTTVNKLPSTGGTTSWTPNQALLFMDGTEQLFSRLVHEAGEFWGLLGGWFSGFKR